MTPAELYERGVQTLLASWEEYARGSHGAAVIRGVGVTSAVFPEEPERSVYNNAVLDRGLGPAQRAEALGAMAMAYASASVDRFAAWVHESDEAMRDELEARGHALAESTRAMGLVLADVPIARPEPGSPRRTGPSICASVVCRTASCAASMSAPSGSWSLEWRGRAWRRRSPSTTRTTAASSTS